MRFVATCFDHCNPHAGCIHLLKCYDIQSCTYAETLVFRMHGQQHDLSSLVFLLEFICHKADNLIVCYRNQNVESLMIFAYRLHSLSLTLSPIWIEDGIDSGPQYLLERTENWFPGQ